MAEKPRDAANYTEMSLRIKGCTELLKCHSTTAPRVRPGRHIRWLRRNEFIETFIEFIALVSINVFAYTCNTVALTLIN